jgi:hypothetical protein
MSSAYVVTLDADTRALPDAIKQLIGANRPPAEPAPHRDGARDRATR